jgi:hypothetical protein
MLRSLWLLQTQCEVLRRSELRPNRTHKMLTGEPLSIQTASHGVRDEFHLWWWVWKDIPEGSPVFFISSQPHSELFQLWACENLPSGKSPSWAWYSRSLAIIMWPLQMIQQESEHMFMLLSICLIILWLKYALHLCPCTDRERAQLSQDVQSMCAS